MPHACTNCGRTFPDGSKEMLSGCPDCGGNKFRYHPDSVPENTTTDTSRESAPENDQGIPPRDRGSGVVDRATTTVREWVNQRSDPSPPTGHTSEGAPDARPSSESPPGRKTEDTSSSPTADPSSDTAAATTQPPTGGTRDESTAEPAGAEDDPPTASDGDDPEDTAQADARAGVATPDELPESGEGPTDGVTSPDGPRSSGAGRPRETTGETVPETPDDTSRAAETPDGDARTSPRASGDAYATAPDGSDTVPDGEPPTTPGDDRRTTRREPAEPSSTPASSNLAQLREELNEQFESIKIVEPGEYELNLMGLYDREEYIISLLEDGRYAIEVPETWRDSEDTDAE